MENKYLEKLASNRFVKEMLKVVKKPVQNASANVRMSPKAVIDNLKNQAKYLSTHTQVPSLKSYQGKPLKKQVFNDVTLGDTATVTSKGRSEQASHLKEVRQRKSEANSALKDSMKDYW